VRLEYPSEVELNGEAKANARLAWAELGWRIFPLLAKKARVILAKHGPAIRNRFILGQAARTTRRGNVCLLGTIGRAVLGWARLRKADPRFANLLLLYCGFATLLHLPFTMNTCLRIPLVDPILCVLAGLYVSPLSRDSPAE